MKRKSAGPLAPRIVATLLTILFSSVAVYAAVNSFVRAPEAPPTPPAQSENAGTESGGEAGGTVAEDTQTAPDGKARKEYCYTILVSGLDNDNGGSDTNILVRFDAKNKTIDLVSLPRDTLLNHQWVSNKLNFAYARGGTALLQEEIENLLGIPVDFYVSVDLAAFIALVDQIGGVQFDIPMDMDYDDPYQNLHIHFKKGPRLLNGQEAMEVVRWRKNNDGSGYAAADIGRIGTQQAFLKEVAKELLQIGNVKEIPALAEIFFTYVKTDLTLGNLVWLGTEALGIGMDGVRFHTLPGDGMGYYRGESVYEVDPVAALALVNDALNPYVADITAEDMDVLVP